MTNTNSENGKSQTWPNSQEIIGLEDSTLLINDTLISLKEAVNQTYSGLSKFAQAKQSIIEFASVAEKLDLQMEELARIEQQMSSLADAMSKMTEIAGTQSNTSQSVNQSRLLWSNN